MVLLAVLVALSFLIVEPLLLAIAFGALLAYVVYPLYRLLLRRVHSKTFSSLLVCLLVIVILVAVGGFFVKTLVEESYLLFIIVKQKLARGLFTGCYNSFCLAIEDFIGNPEISSQLQETIKSITNLIIKRGSGILISIPNMILNLFVVFFTMFYFLKDGEELIGKIHDFLVAQQEKYKTVIPRLKEIVHGVIYGYILIAIIQGTLGALGFFIFGVSSPILWGLVMAFLALVPLVGTGLVWVPASLFLLLDGIFQGSNGLIFKGIGLFLYGLLVVSSIDNILRPTLMGNKAKIHPAVIMLGIFGGLLFFGSVGVLIGPLVLSLMVVVVETYLKKN